MRHVVAQTKPPARLLDGRDEEMGCAPLPDGALEAPRSSHAQPHRRCWPGCRRERPWMELASCRHGQSPAPRSPPACSAETHCFLRISAWAPQKRLDSFKAFQSSASCTTPLAVITCCYIETPCKRTWEGRPAPRRTQGWLHEAELPRNLRQVISCWTAVGLLQDVSNNRALWYESHA